MIQNDRGSSFYEFGPSVLSLCSVSINFSAENVFFYFCILLKILCEKYLQN